MDPVSHALLGAAAGCSVARTRVAALAGLAAALLPDADVLIGSSSDPLVTLEYHRQFSHSLFVAPIGALVVAGALWMLLRGRIALKPSSLYWPALAGYLSAVLLDACTSYGTQLLWPFSDRRFSASIVAVIDPVVPLILAAGLVAALRAVAAAPAQIAVGLVAVYLGFGWVQRERAETLVERVALERGHVISRHEVKPTLGNLLLWRSVYLDGDDYVVDAPRVALSSTLYPGGRVARIQPIDLVPPLTLDSTQAADVVRFGKVSDGYLARHPSRPNVIGDIRYAMLPDSTRPLWGIEIQPERQDHHVGFSTFREFSSKDRARFFAMLRGADPAALARADSGRHTRRIQPATPR